MRVKELIAKLQEIDPDFEVVMQRPDGEIVYDIEGLETGTYERATGDYCPNNGIAPDILNAVAIRTTSD